MGMFGKRAVEKRGIMRRRRFGKRYERDLGRRRWVNTRWGQYLALQLPLSIPITLETAVD